ncbi:MAG TPA: hypothetical protein VL240_06795 [Candidatus Binatia bacterium]|nr:hypothetical protein [Candidatus Binatia bacterium]
MCRFLLAVLFFFATASYLPAQFPMPVPHVQEDMQPAQIRELVSKYCRLEYEGTRLDPQGWPKFQPLVWWTSAPQYPQIDVVARYVVDNEPASSHGKYTVSVHYRLLGIYDLVSGYAPEAPGAMQDVEFTVTLENSEWRIADAENTYPHPSRAAMLKWLNEKLSTAQDESARNRYQDALKKLQAQSGSPFAR